MAARGTRGGRRQGTPGKTYANRTDLMTNYGPSQGGASVATGGMLPVAPAGPPGPPPTPGPLSQNGTGLPTLTPDQVTPLDAPTQRPHEPVTTGLPYGPGAGPEALNPSPTVAAWTNAHQLITAAAAAPTASPALQMLANRIRAGY